MTGAIVGTPGYVAPELFHGHEPSPQGDLYALGVMAFDMLCGRPPFRGNTAAELLKQHLFDTPPAPSSVVSGLPAALDALVLALLAKDPTQRPRSAKDVDAALAAIAAGAAPVIVPLSPVQATEVAMPTPTPLTLSAMKAQSSSSVAPPSSPSSSVSLSPAPPASLSKRTALIAAAAGVAVVGLVAVGVAVGRRGERDGVVTPPAPVVAAVAAVPPPPAPVIAAPAVAAVVAAPAVVAEANDPPKKKEKEKEKEKKAATTTKTPEPPPPPEPPKAERKKAFLGAVPDRNFRGRGVLLRGVVHGSPAAAVFLVDDLLIAVGNDAVEHVNDLSRALSTHAAGERVRITFFRDGVEHAVDLNLVEPMTGAEDHPEGRRRRRLDGDKLNDALNNVGKAIDRFAGH